VKRVSKLISAEEYSPLRGTYDRKGRLKDDTRNN